MVDVSVIIPTYNRAQYVGDAVRSVHKQTFATGKRPAIEIIVADDGSTDNTPQVMEAFGNQVIYLRCAHRGQPAATRNAALKRAQGEFIAFLDSDDLFLPHKLERQLSAFTHYPEAGVVYSDGDFFRRTPTLVEGHVLDGQPTPSGHVFGDLVAGNFLFLQTTLIRRSALEAVGPFDENRDFFAVEDYELLLRLAAQVQFVYEPGSVAAIRRHAGSISKEVLALKRRILHVLNKIEACFPELATRHAGAFHEAAVRLHGALAWGDLRNRRLWASLSHSVICGKHVAHVPGRTIHWTIAWLSNHHKRHSALA